ncbi:6228_t:CDS:1 [Cetraspora pellucida]|uniref:6228_t:CDS:1 n=1 Tax=Cetraspora pellucida TaxID=1433469 RepID=A0A9N9IFY7_9GLOM|nr:6228_t:CDS:1 [Cetraspora pellucida]
MSCFLVEQMKEGLYYTINQSLVEEVKLLTNYKPIPSEDLEDEPDAIALYAIYLLERLNQDVIKEVWKVSRVTSDRTNYFIFLLADGLYSCTCLLQQRKELVC